MMMLVHDATVGFNMVVVLLGHKAAVDTKKRYTAPGVILLDRTRDIRY